MFYAVMAESLSIIKFLIQRGADINLAGGFFPEDLNLLLFLLKSEPTYKNDEIIHYLINDAKIDTKCSDENGDTIDAVF